MNVFVGRISYHIEIVLETVLQINLITFVDKRVARVTSVAVRCERI